VGPGFPRASAGARRICRAGYPASCHPSG